MTLLADCVYLAALLHQKKETQMAVLEDTNGLVEGPLTMASIANASLLELEEAQLTIVKTKDQVEARLYVIRKKAKNLYEQETGLGGFAMLTDAQRQTWFDEALAIIQGTEDNGVVVDHD